MQQGGRSPSVDREGVAAGCHSLSGYSDEEFGDTTVHLLPVLRVVLPVPAAGIPCTALW